MTLTEQQTTSFTANGVAVSVSSSHPHLLAALSEELNITSAEGRLRTIRAMRRLCAVLLDGKPIQACLVSMEKAEGKVRHDPRGIRPGRA